ncbi:type II secretion system GspH family protein [Acidobacteria bacterium AH-259-A15]|nr:type II secretion system GspH family protein [Acidobacteria bacterium AH-259-A15]
MIGVGVSERRSHASGGFTLTEMLITTAVLSIVGGAIVALLWQSQRSYQSQQDLITVTQEARLAMDQIIRYLQLAGNDPEEIFASQTPPFEHTHAGVSPIEIGTTAPDWNIRIHSDITGAVPDAGAPTDPLKATGDPDGTLNNRFEQVVVSYNSATNELSLDIGNGAGVLAENISSFSLTFYDMAGNVTSTESDIARVQVELVAETENADQQTAKVSTITLQSDVMLHSQSFDPFAS